MIPVCVSGDPTSRAHGREHLGTLGSCPSINGNWPDTFVWIKFYPFNGNHIPAANFSRALITTLFPDAHQVYRAEPFRGSASLCSYPGKVAAGASKGIRRCRMTCPILGEKQIYRLPEHGRQAGHSVIFRCQRSPGHLPSGIYPGGCRTGLPDGSHRKKITPRNYRSRGAE